MPGLRPRWPILLLASLVTALLVGCPAPRDQQPIRVVVSDDSDNQSSRPSANSVLELARREGELWWYTSLPDKPAQEFIKLFTHKNPFITVHLVRESTFDIIQRLQTEVDNGKVQADVLHVLDVAPFVKLKKQGQLLRYESPQERFIPAQYKDPGEWAALRCVALCIAYNTQKVKEKPPKTWPDLLESRFVGRIALKDAQTAGSAYAHYFFLREEYGVSYWRRMAAEKPQMFKTAEESISALKTGAVDIVSGAMDYTVDDAQRSGSPIRAVWPTDGVPVMLGPVAILRAAPHPNTARLFMDFALSTDGQKALRDLLGGYSVRGDVPAPEGLPPLTSLHTMAPAGGWDAYTVSQDILKSEYTRLFHPGSE
jgi:iron(III) transport system substrate-binding protein